MTQAQVSSGYDFPQLYYDDCYVEIDRVMYWPSRRAREVIYYLT
jgi:hypothetical protein